MQELAAVKLVHGSIWIFVIGLRKSPSGFPILSFWVWCDDRYANKFGKSLDMVHQTDAMSEWAEVALCN